jgi:hypothetical protein
LKERGKVFERGASPLLDAPYVKGEGEYIKKRGFAPSSFPSGGIIFTGRIEIPCKKT